jgi:hypothetical protein
VTPLVEPGRRQREALGLDGFNRSSPGKRDVTKG